MSVKENKPKIVVADSQFLIVDSLIRLIKSENNYVFCGSADNRLNLIKLLNSDKPDLLITDINLIDYDGIEDLKSILEEYKQLSILILTNQLNTSEVNKLIKSGIKNIALKTDEKQDLLNSIDMAVKKKKHFNDQILDIILEQNENRNATTESFCLTPAEIEIVKLIGNGFTTKEIAEKKHISFHTVMTHRKNIFRKLEINSISELIKFAIRKGLIDFIEYNI